MRVLLWPACTAVLGRSSWCLVLAFLFLTSYNLCVRVRQLNSKFGFRFAWTEITSLLHSSGAEEQLQERRQPLWQGPLGAGDTARALLELPRDNILHPRLAKAWIQRCGSGCWSPGRFVPLVPSAGTHSRTFSPSFTSCQGARLEQTLLPLEGLGQGGEPELSLLIQILAVTQFFSPGEPAYPFPDSFTHGKCTGETNTVGHDALSWGPALAVACARPEHWAPPQRRCRFFNLVCCL